MPRNYIRGLITTWFLWTLPGRMTTMASDYGSSSSSELDEEPSNRLADESDTTVLSPSGDDILDDEDPASRDSLRGNTPDEEPPAAVTMTARAYQLEMLEESLKQNIIVAVCLRRPAPS